MYQLTCPSKILVSYDFDELVGFPFVILSMLLLTFSLFVLVPFHKAGPKMMRLRHCLSRLDYARNTRTDRASVGAGFGPAGVIKEGMSYADSQIEQLRAVY